MLLMIWISGLIPYKSGEITLLLSISPIQYYGFARETNRNFPRLLLWYKTFDLFIKSLALMIFAGGSHPEAMGTIS